MTRDPSGDAYFDEQWRPVKIVDAGLSPPNAAWDSQAPVVTQPGDEGREPVLSPAGNRREAEGTRSPKMVHVGIHIPYPRHSNLYGIYAYNSASINNSPNHANV